MSKPTDLIEEVYLGKRVHDLLVTLTNQLAVVYKARGITVPVIASSTVDQLSRSSGASIADIARALDITHQLATQRMDKLNRCGLVEKRPDPNDARRVIWALTAEGCKQAERLEVCMNDAMTVHEKLFEDIGFDLMSALDKAKSALNTHPLSERFASLNDVKLAG